MDLPVGAAMAGSAKPIARQDVMSNRSVLVKSDAFPLVRENQLYVVKTSVNNLGLNYSF